MTEQEPTATAPMVPIPPVSAELELAQRRELAIRATDAVSEVLEQDITIRGLEIMTAASSKRTRLTAKRALRCVEAIARPDSEIVRAVGEIGIYDYVECVLLYGADNKKFLQLVDKEGFSAAEVTGLYALRELISEYTDDKRQGFPSIEGALQTLGISLVDAANDPEGAVEQLDKAGYFIDHAYSRTFDRPILSPNLSARPAGIVEDDPDGSLSEAIIEGQRSEFSRPLDEIDDESEMQEAQEIAVKLNDLVNG